MRFSSLPILWSRTNPTFGHYMEDGHHPSQMQSPNRKTDRVAGIWRSRHQAGYSPPCSDSSRRKRKDV